MRDATTKELTSRHVKPEESVRLGVVSGWYTTKMSGTFVSGPHDTKEDAQKKILELQPPVTPTRRTA